LFIGYPANPSLERDYGGPKFLEFLSLQDFKWRMIAIDETIPKALLSQVPKGPMHMTKICKLMSSLLKIFKK
jgi:hypothetical protein